MQKKSNQNLSPLTVKCRSGSQNLYRTFRDQMYFVCVEVLRPRQPNGVMSSSVSLPNHTFTGQA